MRTSRPFKGLAVALLLAGTLLALPSRAQAQVGGANTFGIGIVAGYPDLGLSINYFLSGATSLQIDPVFHFDDGKDSDRFAIGGRLDFLFWMPTLAALGGADLVWYWGPGVNLGLGVGDQGNFGLGAELPIGLGLQLTSVPLDLCLEAVPVLHIIQDVNLGIGGALAVRYYF